MQRIPLARPAWDIEMRNAALKVLESKRWVKGSENIAFGTEFSEWCGAEFAIPCFNGSVALWASLRLLGIGPGDEVIVPSLTFIATATAVSLVGAKPVFVDVERKYWCLCPKSVERAITEQTKAVIGVHLFGQCFSPEIRKICNKYNLFLIEDAAQAHGASLEGKKAGSIGDLGCFSFFPSKNMAVGGEGGMITTTKLDLVNRMQRFVDHGRDKDLEAIELTSNLRMSEVQAAIGRIQLTKVEGWVERRREIAHQFDFSAHERPNTQHSWHQYCILSDEPQNLISRMDAAEIDARVYYPLPCHRQAVFSNHEQYNTELAVTDEIAPRLVAIPVHPFLTEAEIERIIKAVNG